MNDKIIFPFDKQGFREANINRRPEAPTAVIPESNVPLVNEYNHLS